jgi:hypothetical protein
MIASIENRKLAVIDHLAELEDDYILQQIENLLKPKHDFWNDLNSQEKDKIEKGILQAKNGEVVDFESFINEIIK